MAGLWKQEAITAAVLLLVGWGAQLTTGQGLLPPKTRLGASLVAQRVPGLEAFYKSVKSSERLQAAAAQKRLPAVLCETGKCPLGASTNSLGSGRTGGSSGSAQGASFDAAAQEALMLALSPRSYSAANPQQTWGKLALTPSINQSVCQTCTAQAVASAAATAVASVLHIAAADVSLSVMDLYYCSTTTPRSCSSGAELEQIIKQLTSQTPVKDACFSYTANSAWLSSGRVAEQICQLPPKGLKACSDRHDVVAKGSFAYFSPGSVGEIVEHIRMYGSVITQFNFYSDFKPFFANKGNSQAVYRRSSTAQPIPDVAHAVLLVGYHLDSQQPSNSYWIVKNSWGTNWADGGLFRMELNYPGYEAGNIFAITWTPDPAAMPGYEPLPGLKPDPLLQQCCVYKASPYDCLASIAYKAQVSYGTLLADNMDIVTQLKDLGGSLADKTLRICNSPACNDARDPTAQQDMMSSGKADYAVSLLSSISGYDIDCQQINEYNSSVTYCKVCGGVAEVAKACDSNNDCKAFDMEGEDCGYLKKQQAKASLEFSANFASYCKLAPGNSCAGTYTYKRDLSTPGNELDCNFKDEVSKIKQPFCFVSGDVLAVAAFCDRLQTCKAFDYAPRNRGRVGGRLGGYLKSSAGGQKTPGGAAYVRRR